MSSQRIFNLAIVSEMVFFSSDTLGVLAINHLFSSNEIILMWSKNIYFFSTACMCFFWFLYFEHLRETEFIGKVELVRWSSIVLWIMAVLLAYNFFTKMLFYVDGNGNYHRGKYFILTYIVSYFYVVVSWIRIMIDIIRNEDKKDRSLLLSLALFPVAPGIAGVIQFVYPWIPVACVAMSVTTLILYLAWVDQLISHDPLTGLINRKQLLYLFTQWKKNLSNLGSSYLILIDATSSIRKINNVYGHLEGDNAIKIVSRAVLLASQIFDDRPVIGRYSGNEFIVLLSSGSNEAVNIFNQMIIDMLSKIVNEEKAKYDVNVTIGVARFKGQNSLKEMIESADIAIQNKEKIKK